MDISIIVPTYKPDKYIYDCLQSIVNQTYDKTSFELIVILNGSPKEPYYSEIDSFLKNKGTIYKLFYSNSAGVSIARNIGLDNANGEYITFIDDDDYISENFLEELYKKASFDTISIARPFDFYENGRKILKTDLLESAFYICKEKNKQKFYRARRFFSGPCRKLIHKNIIGSRRFNNKFKNGEDSLFMFLISDRMQYVDFTSDTAIYYRRLRFDSASKKPKKLSYRLTNNTLMIMEYCKYYISNITEYNFYFFCTRILGSLKMIFKKNW